MEGWPSDEHINVLESKRALVFFCLENYVWQTRTCARMPIYLSCITKLQDYEGGWSRGLAPCAVTIYRGRLPIGFARVRSRSPEFSLDLTR